MELSQKAAVDSGQSSSFFQLTTSAASTSILEKREQFAVSLRKKKRADLLKEKRNKIFENYIRPSLQISAKEAEDEEKSAMSVDEQSEACHSPLPLDMHILEDLPMSFQHLVESLQQTMSWTTKKLAVLSSQRKLEKFLNRTELLTKLSAVAEALLSQLLIAGQEAIECSVRDCVDHLIGILVALSSLADPEIFQLESQGKTKSSFIFSLAVLPPPASQCRQKMFKRKQKFLVKQIFDILEHLDRSLFKITLVNGVAVLLGNLTMDGLTAKANLVALLLKYEPLVRSLFDLDHAIDKKPSSSSLGRNRRDMLEEEDIGSKPTGEKIENSPYCLLKTLESISWALQSILRFDNANEANLILRHQTDEEKPSKKPALALFSSLALSISEKQLHLQIGEQEQPIQETVSEIEVALIQIFTKLLEAKPGQKPFVKKLLADSAFHEMVLARIENCIPGLAAARPPEETNYCAFVFVQALLAQSQQTSSKRKDDDPKLQWKIEEFVDAIIKVAQWFLSAEVCRQGGQMQWPIVHQSLSALRDALETPTIQLQQTETIFNLAVGSPQFDLAGVFCRVEVFTQSEFTRAALSWLDTLISLSKRVRLASTEGLTLASGCQSILRALNELSAQVSASSQTAQLLLSRTLDLVIETLVDRTQSQTLSIDLQFVQADLTALVDSLADAYSNTVPSSKKADVFDRATTLLAALRSSEGSDSDRGEDDCRFMI